MTGSYYTDLSYNIAVNGGNEALYEKIATWSGINSYSYSYQTSAEIDVNKYGTDFAKEELENKKQIYEEDFPEDVGKYEYNTLGLTIVMVNNDYFKSYVKSLGMNEKDYSNIAILGDDMMHYLGQGKSKVEHYFNVKAGDLMEVTMDDEQKQIKISKITTERPMGYESCYTEGGYLFVSEDYPVVTKDKSELNSGNLCASVSVVVVTSLASSAAATLVAASPASNTLEYNVVLNGLTFIYTFSFLVNILLTYFLHRLIYYRDFQNLAIVFWKKYYIFATCF